MSKKIQQRLRDVWNSKNASPRLKANAILHPLFPKDLTQDVLEKGINDRWTHIRYGKFIKKQKDVTPSQLKNLFDNIPQQYSQHKFLLHHEIAGHPNAPHSLAHRFVQNVIDGEYNQGDLRGTHTQISSSVAKRIHSPELLDRLMDYVNDEQPYARDVAPVLLHSPASQPRHHIGVFDAIVKGKLSEYSHAGKDFKQLPHGYVDSLYDPGAHHTSRSFLGGHPSLSGEAIHKQAEKLFNEYDINNYIVVARSKTLLDNKNIQPRTIEMIHNNMKALNPMNRAVSSWGPLTVALTVGSVDVSSKILNHKSTPRHIRDDIASNVDSMVRRMPRIFEHYSGRDIIKSPHVRESTIKTALLSTSPHVVRAALQSPHVDGETLNSYVNIMKPLDVARNLSTIMDHKYADDSLREAAVDKVTKSGFPARVAFESGKLSAEHISKLYKAAAKDRQAGKNGDHSIGFEAAKHRNTPADLLTKIHSDSQMAGVSMRNKIHRRLVMNRNTPPEIIADIFKNSSVQRIKDLAKHKMIDKGLAENEEDIKNFS